MTRAYRRDDRLLAATLCNQATLRMLRGQHGAAAVLLGEAYAASAIFDLDSRGGTTIPSAGPGLAAADDAPVDAGSAIPRDARSDGSDGASDAAAAAAGNCPTTTGTGEEITLLDGTISRSAVATMLADALRRHGDVTEARRRATEAVEARGCGEGAARSHPPAAVAIDR